MKADVARIDTTPRTPLQRAAAWYTRKRYGAPLEPVAAGARHPLLMLGYGTFETALEMTRRVDPKLKDLAAIKAASMVGCEWCMDFGSDLGRKNGVTDEQLRDLPRFEQSDAFSELEKLVLRLAAGMTRTPAEISDELVSELGRHLDDAQLVARAATIAIENYRARFNEALDLRSQGFSEGAFCVLPERPDGASASATPQPDAAAR